MRINTSELCPGATDENKHYLVIDDETTGNKLCINDKCDFIIQYPDKTGAWKLKKGIAETLPEHTD